MVGEDEGDGQVMPSYGSYPITISGRGYPAFCDDGRARKPPGFSLLNTDSRAGRDVRVFRRFNSTEQDGHGKSRMVVSLGGHLLLISLLPAQSFCQKIHKYPDFRADGIVAVIDGMERLGYTSRAHPGNSSRRRPLAISAATVKSDRQAMPLPVRHSWRMVSPLLATRCGTAR